MLNIKSQLVIVAVTFTTLSTTSTASRAEFDVYDRILCAREPVSIRAVLSHELLTSFDHGSESINDSYPGEAIAKRKAALSSLGSFPPSSRKREDVIPKDIPVHLTMNPMNGTVSGGFSWVNVIVGDDYNQGVNGWTAKGFWRRPDFVKSVGSRTVQVRCGGNVQIMTLPNHY